MPEHDRSHPAEKAFAAVIERLGASLLTRAIDWAAQNQARDLEGVILVDPDPDATDVDCGFVDELDVGPPQIEVRIADNWVDFSVDGLPYALDLPRVQQLLGAVDPPAA